MGLSQRLARTFASRKEIEILELSTSFTIFRLAKRIEIVGLSTDSSRGKIEIVGLSQRLADCGTVNIMCGVPGAQLFPCPVRQLRRPWDSQRLAQTFVSRKELRLWDLNVFCTNFRLVKKNSRKEIEIVGLSQRLLHKLLSREKKLRL